MSFHCALNVNFISFRQHTHSTILSTRLLAVVVPGQPAIGIGIVVIRAHCAHSLLVQIAYEWYLAQP